MAHWRLKVNSGTNQNNPSYYDEDDDDDNFPPPPSDPIPITIQRSSYQEQEEMPPSGSLCLNCHSCEGLRRHNWRKVCTACHCDPNDHEMPVSEIIDTYRRNRIILHDNNENIVINQEHKDYMWVPAGLESHLIEEYMNELPKDKVPHYKNPVGIAYHNKQLIRQIPLQDSNFKNVITLNDDEKYLFDSLKRERDAALACGKVLMADDIYDCNKCKKNIKKGDLMVNAIELGSEAMWHPACFSCSVCNELLADLIYCHRDATIYCVRHFGELIKSRCCMCDELIFAGEYVRTDDKSYHAKHFVCNICDRGLSGEQHLVDNDLPICIACYDEKCASICRMCDKTIGVDEEVVIYDEKHWHNYCLVCKVCKCWLSGTSFVIRDDDFLCSDCYRKTDDRRCKTCGEGFEPGAKRLELKGEFWHDKCFLCDICQDPITTKKFIQHEGKQVCCPCFDSTFAKKCEKCREPLREGGVACGGTFFHRDCFQCESCNTSIASQAFQQKDGKRFCMPCYKQKYAKRCSGCDKCIVNGEYYTVDEDSWHKDCFRCERCKQVLQQQSFLQENGKIKLVCEKCL